MGSSSVIELPLLPLRDVVVYPHMVLPLFVGREKSIEALEDAMSNDKQVLLAAQRHAADGSKVTAIDNTGYRLIVSGGSKFTPLGLEKICGEETFGIYHMT